MLGETRNDINTWAPGDGGDAYAADLGYDTMIFAPLVTDPNGSVKLEDFNGRQVPRVDISDKPNFSCDIVNVPPSEQLGAQFLVRFEVNNVIAATVRLKDAEQVLCSSQSDDRVLVADLTVAYPSFHQVRLEHFGGALGAIIAKP
jgi:hypothetical protein